MRKVLFSFSIVAAALGSARAADLPEGGAFSAYDVTAKAAVDLSQGTVHVVDGATVYDSGDANGLSVHAVITTMKNRIDVTGTLSNAKGGDRAVILDYRSAPMGVDAIFSNSLDPKGDHKVGSTGEIEGNAFPVASLDSGKKALAMAIPPDDPCVFGVVGSDKGLAVRFYLGLSPDTAKFPNSAPFHFIVYSSEPGWGFRSALEKYYSFYPDRYVPRMKKAGLWLFQVKGITPENIDQYAFNVLEIQNKDVKSDLARDEAHHVRDMVYTLTGQRELKFLPTLPNHKADSKDPAEVEAKNYAEAMQDLANWTVADADKHTPTKENAAAGNDQWLKEEIPSSACKDASGKYVIEIRNTPWGQNSVSFKVNPSPYLFADDPSIKTVGKDSLQLIDGWIAQYPQINGVLMDSLGANWPATFDYRKDHFKYAQYPLTFDSEGRLAVYNQIGHYEFEKALHDKLIKSDRALFGNGLYAYQTGKTAEHYRGTDMKHRIKIGRFFDSALMDGATSEVGARANIERCQDARTSLGKKYYSLINYDWEDADKVEEFFNRALCYDIFASNTKHYPTKSEDYQEGGNEGISYVDNQDGYFRDKTLLKWFVPKARMLYEAGWEPVTHARVSGGPGIWIERYGSGNNVYFTVFNDTPDKKSCSITVDLESLGFSEGTPDYKELARNLELEVADSNQVKLTLEGFRTYIINMTKPWLVGGTQSGATAVGE